MMTEAVVAASDFVRTLASDENYQRPGTSLPTTAELASLAGVSLVTMWRAVAALKQEGLLRAGRGRRICLASQQPAAAVPAPRSQRWLSVADRMEQEVLRGQLPPDSPLPTVKELARQHGVAARTVRSALAELQRRRSIAPHGRGYRVRAARAGRPHGVIALIARGSGGTLHTVTPRTQDHLRTLERSCSRAGVALEALSHDTFLDFARTSDRGQPVLEALASGRPLLGVMLWTVGLAAHPDVPRLVRRLLGLGRPVAVLDEGAMLGSRNLAGVRGRLKVIAMATSSAAGVDVGRLLLSQGHRRVAYICTGSGDPRYTGLAAAFRSAGIPQAVSLFSSSDIGGPGSSHAADLRNVVDAMLASDDPWVARRQEDQSVQNLRFEIDRFLQDTRRRESLLPLFGRVLADKGITAWVGYNDAIALDCLNHLRSIGVVVPQQLSVVGFDDGPAASLHKLTSYNFNGDAAVHGLVNHILRPPARRRGRGEEPQFEESEGFVTVRQTTARPREG